MKRIIPILSTLLALLICSACTNADEPDTQKADTETKDNYYVRYEASIPSGYSGKVTVNTEGLKLFPREEYIQKHLAL